MAEVTGVWAKLARLYFWAVHLLRALVESGGMRLSDRIELGVAPIIAPRRAPVDGLLRAVARVDVLIPDDPAPRDGDPVALCRVAAARFAAEKWPCPQRDIAAAIAHAFVPPCRDRTEFDGLRAALLAECAVTQRAGLLSRFVETYLSGYDPGVRATPALARALAAARPRLPARWAQAFATLPLLHSEGPKRIAADLALRPDAYAALAGAGFRMREGGFISHLQAALLAAWAPGLAWGDDATLSRLIAWVRAGGKQRETGAAEVLTALLAPWADRAPTAAYRQTLIRAVVDLYGDPRGGHGGVWGQLRDRAPGAHAALLRWLAGETLELFIDILAESEAGKHNDMYKKRAEFWRSLAKAERIADSTVALSAPAQAHALRAQRSRPGLERLQWAAQIQSGYGRGGTTILVMRIGEFIVVEGSHSFPVLIFDARDPAAPSLHAPRYDAKRVRDSLPGWGERVITHDSGTWIRKVERMLRL